jgi:hypothetical protein
MHTALIRKIKDAPFTSDPFSHVLIRDFLEPSLLERITADPRVRCPAAADIAELHRSLTDAGWRVRSQAGCFTRIEDYIASRRQGASRRIARAVGDSSRVQLIESAGMNYRCQLAGGTVLDEVVDVFLSREMQDVLLEKFDIREPYKLDCGIQKYLDGYEISPHPDMREKALTFMLNLNTNPRSEEADHHTHFLRFKPQYEYVYSFWERCPEHQRCWVPWEWCTSHYQQRPNNSISIFKPASDTLHAVRARYDDLDHQRTQLYGNYFYKGSRHSQKSSFQEIDLHASAGHAASRATSESAGAGPVSRSARAMTAWVRDRLRWQP